MIFPESKVSSVDSKEFNLIQKAHEKYKFDLVITEGWRFNLGINSSKIIKYVKSLKTKEICEHDFNLLLSLS